MLAERFVERSAPEVVEEIPFEPAALARLKERRWILHYAAKNGVGAEIGVFRGQFSAVLAETLQPSRLYLVDPWRRLGPTFGWGEDSAYTGFGKLTTERALHDTIRHVAGFPQMDVKVVEAYSKEFFSELEEKLDWVYLDASHQYDKTLHEITMASRALKSGGVILGDDWQPFPARKHHGVFRAVRDFCKNHPFEIVAAGPAGQWCIRGVTS